MIRHAPVHRSRAGRAAVVSAAAVALAAGLTPLLPSASATAAPAETVIPATLRGSYASAALLTPSTRQGHDGVGARGVFHRLEGGSDLWWTPFDGGEPVRVPGRQGTFTQATGTDVVFFHSAGRTDFRDLATGTERSVLMPEGLVHQSAYDNLVIAFRGITGADGTSRHEMHLLTPGADDTTRDVTVTGGPEALALGPTVGADDRSVFFRAALDGTPRLAAVDRETGRVESWTQPLPTAYSGLVLSPDHVAVVAPDRAKVLVLPRGELSATPAEVTVAGAADGTNVARDVALVGDWLVSGSTRVQAQPLAGGEPVTLMAQSSSQGTGVGPGGTAVRVGRTGADDWGIQRIRAGADGRPAVTMVKPLPKPPYPVQGLSLDQGRLAVADYGTVHGANGGRIVRTRTVAAAGTPEFGDASVLLDSGANVPLCASGDLACAPLHGTPDGRVVWQIPGADGGADVIRVTGGQGSAFWQRGVEKGGRVTGVSGRYVLYTGPTRQDVYRIGDDGKAAVTRTPTAAALSGDLLWTPGTAPGTVTAYSLPAKKTTETVTLGSGCVPTELQALGRWLYWACDGRAGVHDRTTGRSVSVPADEAELGDGYVVTHDRGTGKLTLTSFADGTAAGRVIGELPDTGASQRDVRWTVDESGADVAWVDGQERVHLVPSGVPQQPLRLLAPAGSPASVPAMEPDTVPRTLTSLLLSKPASGWRLTVRARTTGKVVDTVSGGAARGALDIGWHGVPRNAHGWSAPLPIGSYDWTVTVDPADGTGQPLQVSGTVRLTGATPVRHDHADPDGVGDLLTLNSSGSLTFQLGTGKGTFSGKVSGGGWSAKTVAVPFGDLNGDHCNDVLVRMADGSLRGYKVPCGSGLVPSRSYKKLGTGWSAYNVLTSPGDLTGDGRADLLGRKASTGDVCLFAAKSDGTLAAGKKIGSAWKGYTKVVGAGDLNGDGTGDVLARDKAGTLWRYDGTGTGKLRARAKVFSKWGGSYNAIVGVGDITGDGRSDLVVRDGAGVLYRNNGDGKGKFAGRVRIGGGWGGYKGLF
ncbi:VCBS repeat-containing protein [Streptomyces sp. NPDC005435]|uniref:FG-GAP repeat domain-containing protein n=1 Tax=Streptomyces sp. NPDC005435 TaxID=3154464 RepID=UPI0034557D04